MMGRRIFSAIGTPKTNMFVHISCIALTPLARGYHVTLTRNSVTQFRHAIPSRNSGVSAMPVGVQLVDARALNHGDIVDGARHELQTHGKILFREAAGHEQSVNPAQITDPTQPIAERTASLEIHLQ